MPHFQVRAHLQLLHELAIELARQEPGLAPAARELVVALEELAACFESSPLRHIRFTEVANGFGGAEVVLEEALRDLREQQADQAAAKCRIARKMVDRVRQAITPDGEG